MEFDDCTYCGGEVTLKNIELDYRYNDELFIFTNVPTGVCNQCGEKFLKSKTAKDIEKKIMSGTAPSELKQVPVHALT